MNPSPKRTRREAGRLGGLATKKKMPADYFRKIGKLGGMTKATNSSSRA